MRPSRSVVLPPLALLLTVLALAVVPASASPAAGPRVPKPQVSRLLTVEGPLSGARVTIVGRHFAGVRAVTFGGARATSVVRRGDRLTVTAPSRRSPGRVPVRVRTKSGWSAVKPSSYFTYRAAPVVRGVQPSTGEFTGGTRVTVSGSGFTRAVSVTFGGAPARIVSATDGTAVVVAPPGVLGPASVRVTTAGGRSATGAAFDYVLPADREDSVIATQDDVVLAQGVQWVTGGNPVDGPEAGLLLPWVVGLSASTPTPSLGDLYYVPPGSEVYPAGLAGRVTAVAAQRDGTVRLTVEPEDLDTLFDDFSGAFSGPVGDASGVERGEPGARRAGSRDSKFGIRGAGPFDCSNDDDTQAAPIQSSLGFGLENIHLSERHELGALRTPSIDVALTADLVTYGSISAQASVECDLKASWANANRKPFALPIPGLTVSFGPTASITVTGSGTWSFEKRTQVTLAASYTVGQRPSVTRVVRERSTGTSASASISVDASFGVSAQVAVLDRAGIELKAQVGFAGDVTVSGPPPQACVGGEVYAKASIGLFLDLWVKRWTFDVAEVRIRVARVELCTDTAESLAAANAPEITSLRLPDAELGSSYDERLTTRDDRGGRWAADRMPAGLTLDPDDGSISGTPTGSVGDHSFVVRFTDGEGRTAVETVRLYAFPARGLAGGDVQITLTWDSEADLDLHVNDPWGEDIWYLNRASESGGRLDYDANAACGEQQVAPTENIHWPYGEAPDGRYDLAAEVYSDCGTDDLDWTLTARVNGRVVLQRTGYGDSEEYFVRIDDGVVTEVGTLGRRTIPARRMTKG